jgi:hypothetical protein
MISISPMDWVNCCEYHRYKFNDHHKDLQNILLNLSFLPLANNVNVNITFIKT